MKTIKLFITLLLLSILANTALAQDNSGILFNVSGKGQPIILIPGLTSDGSVWKETIASMDKKYEFHVLTLPGFAGNPSIENLTDNYLERMRDEIIAYTKKKKLKNPILIGHSLGGFLALSIAIKNPNLPSKLIIIDSLPYLPAIRNPAITPETAKAYAINYRKGMMAKGNLPLKKKKENQRSFLKWMIADPKKIDLAITWYLDSDNKTVAQAMYEMNTTDLRDQLDKIQTPVLVLGSWIAGKPYGATKNGALKSYKAQYIKLKQLRIDMSDKGKHFIMWDDPEFIQKWLKKFL